MPHARHATTVCSIAVVLAFSIIAQAAGRKDSASADSASNDLPTIIELTPKSSDTAARTRDTIVRAATPAKRAVDTVVKAAPARPAVVETTESLAAPAEKLQEPVLEHTEKPPEHLPDFSLFDYRKIISVGPWLSYFYYNEDIDISPLVQSYRDYYGTSPRLVGTPKSSEYGALIGVRLQIPHYLRKPNLFIRPGVTLLLGLNNTYDGSTMGEVYDSGSNAAGVRFDPVVMQKNNIFLFGSCDIGYTFSPGRWNFVAYSGLDGKLWIRDMTQSSSSDGTGSSVSTSEDYYWFSVPVGAIIARPVSSRAIIGIEPRIDFMFFGQMQIDQSDMSSNITYNYPAVTLGNRASYKLETFLQLRLRERTSLTFSLFGLLYGFGKSNTDSVTVSDGYSSEKIAFLEPSSGSYQIGFTINVGFLRKRYGADPAPLPKQGE